ncbi:MAG TPA: CopG family antitoxin [Bryobacteraceae bacterium]
MDGTKKELPQFNTEDEEQEFLAKADSTEYIDWSSAERSDGKSLTDGRGSLRDGGQLK